MNLNYEYLARAEQHARLREAEQCRPGRRLAGALRTSRHAERLAQQARLALARTF
jgi:hypothetical protein